MTWVTIIHKSQSLMQHTHTYDSPTVHLYFASTKFKWIDVSVRYLFISQKYFRIARMAKTSGSRRAVQSRVNESKVFPATKPRDKSWAQITSFSPFRCHIQETTSKSTFQGKTSKDRIWKLDGLLFFCCAPFSFITFMALRHYCYFQYNEMKFIKKKFFSGGSKIWLQSCPWTSCTKME